MLYFSVDASGGNPSYEYQFIIMKDYKELLKTDYQSDNEYEVRNTNLGELTMYANVKDADGNIIKTNEIEVTVYEYFTVDIEIEGVSKSEDIYDGTKKQLYATVGDEIILKAIATGGSGEYTYKYVSENLDTGEVTVHRDNHPSSVYRTRLASPGKNKLIVYVIDSNGEIVETNSVIVTVHEKLEATLELSDVDKDMTIYEGDSITYKITGKGGSGGYVYNYFIETDGVRDYTGRIDSNVYTKQIENIGEVKIYAYIIDSEGNSSITNTINLTVVKNLESKLSVNESVNISYIDKGNSIVFTATGEGGKGAYTYKFIEYDIKTKKWTKLADNITSNTYTWKAQTEGNRVFYVDIKDSKGKVTRSKAVSVSAVSELEVKK